MNMGNKYKLVFCVLLITDSFCALNQDQNLGFTTHKGKQKEDHVTPSEGTKLHDEAADFGQPLFLTPYIESGNIETARQAALVEPLCCNVTSYSGFLTVNKENGTNMFFWFFPAEIDNSTAPVLIWLEGGPGDSSMKSVFQQTSPFCLTKTLKIVPRKYHWTKTISILYIDQPAGTGFSFTGKIQDYTIIDDNVKNLYITIIQFFQIFPKFVENDFYIFGQSYGGKTAAKLGHLIGENLLENQRKVNLKGIIFNSVFLDPINMIHYSNNFHQIGLIDWNTYLELKKFEKNLINSIKKENYLKSAAITVNIVDFLNQKTGFEKFENLLSPTGYNLLNLNDFFNNPEVRKRIHVGKIEFHESSTVKNYLKIDNLKSVKPLIETLIERYKVVVAYGQLDLLLWYTTIERFMFSMNWSGTEEYRTAERKLWYVDDELAGYMKTVRNFTEVLVRNAGHITPISQSKWCFDLLHRITHDFL